MDWRLLVLCVGRRGSAVTLNAVARTTVSEPALAVLRRLIVTCLNGRRALRAKDRVIARRTAGFSVMRVLFAAFAFTRMRFEPATYGPRFGSRNPRRRAVVRLIVARKVQVPAIDKRHVAGSLFARNFDQRAFARARWLST